MACKLAVWDWGTLLPPTVRRYSMEAYQNDAAFIIKLDYLHYKDSNATCIYIAYMAGQLAIRQAVHAHGSKQLQGLLEQKSTSSNTFDHAQKSVAFKPQHALCRVLSP